MLQHASVQHCDTRIHIACTAYYNKIKITNKYTHLQHKIEEFKQMATDFKKKNENKQKRYFENI